MNFISGCNHISIYSVFKSVLIPGPI